MTDNRFSHLNRENQPKMVDISAKAASYRIAEARTTIILPERVTRALVDQEIHTSKGPVFQTAVIAATMACKRTHELIPFCHPIGLDSCNVDIRCNGKNLVIINCKVSVFGKTGIEMEALTGASIAALTIYDMCKAFSHNITIKETCLIEKTGLFHC